MYRKNHEGKPLEYWCACVKTMTSPEALKNHVWNAVRQKKIFDDLPAGVAHGIRDCAGFVRSKVEEITATLPRLLERELRFPEGEGWQVYLPPFLSAYEDVVEGKKKEYNGRMHSAVLAMAEGHAIADRALQICQRLKEIPPCKDVLQKTYSMEDVVAYDMLSPDQAHAKELLEKLIASINRFHKICAHHHPPIDPPAALSDRLSALFFALQGFMYGKQSKNLHTLASLQEDYAAIMQEMERVLANS